MRLKILAIAIAMIAAGYLAFGGSHPATAACQDNMAAVKAAIDKEQDAGKKQKATEELLAAQQSTADEDACNNHLEKAKDHLKK